MTVATFLVPGTTTVWFTRCILWQLCSTPKLPGKLPVLHGWVHLEVHGHRICSQWAMLVSVSVCAGCICASSGRSWRCSMITRHWQLASVLDRMQRSLHQRAWIALLKCSASNWLMFRTISCMPLYWLMLAYVEPYNRHIFLIDRQKCAAAYSYL